MGESEFKFTLLSFYALDIPGNHARGASQICSTLQSNCASQVSFFELDASLAVITLGSRTDSRRGRFVTRWCSANDGGGTNLPLERSLHKEIFRLSSSPSISAAAAPDISHSFVTWSKEMTDAAASKLQPTSSLPVKLSTAPHPVMHDGNL